MKKDTKVQDSQVARHNSNEMLGDATFIDTPMPGNYDEFKSGYWEAKWGERLPDFIKNLPTGYKIVRSGELQEGDLLWNMIDGWEVKPISKDNPRWGHYKDTPVGFWKCVARSIA